MTVKLERMLNHQEWLLHKILERITTMSAALDRLTQEVAENRTAVDSAITLIGGLADQIRELKDDPAALEALANELEQQQADIGAAVTANTPSEGGGEPTEEPTEEPDA